MKLIHFLYSVVGHIFCHFCLMYWNIRDFLCKPNEISVLFIAHPDDETIFFHSFIKEYKPYVVLITTGWSLRRMPGFFKTMRQYGVKYRAYDMGSNDQRTSLIQKRVRRILSLGSFEICATHNSEGEYGHEMHKRIHYAVLGEANIPVMVPVRRDCISYFPLGASIIEEKLAIINRFYKTEKWVVEQYSEWVNNEKLERVTK